MSFPAPSDGMKMCLIVWQPQSRPYHPPCRQYRPYLSINKSEKVLKLLHGSDFYKVAGINGPKLQISRCIVTNVNSLILHFSPALPALKRFNAGNLKVYLEKLPNALNSQMPKQGECPIKPVIPLKANPLYLESVQA